MGVAFSDGLTTENCGTSSPRSLPLEPEQESWKHTNPGSSTPPGKWDLFVQKGLNGCKSWHRDLSAAKTQLFSPFVLPTKTATTLQVIIPWCRDVCKNSAAALVPSQPSAVTLPSLHHRRLQDIKMTTKSHVSNNWTCPPTATRQNSDDQVIFRSEKN